MKYEDHCRRLFQGVELNIEDLYLLESYQIAYLRERAPQREMAAVLQANPSLERFFINKCPEIADFLEDLAGRFSVASSDEELEGFSDSLVWEVAEMIVYSKQPELYDERAVWGWDLADVHQVASMDNKVVIDGGAGTGRVAFAAASKAQHVFAVEPNASMRRFIRRKAKETSVENVYPIDGFLDGIPLPDASADLLITSNAIGWRLEDELREIERVLKPGGKAVHLVSSPGDAEDEPGLIAMTSPAWHYQCVTYDDRDGDRRGKRQMFHKQIP